MLGCGECDNRQFVAVDDLGQDNICRRCGASGPLTQPQWHKPYDEPHWFYDLHAVARDLLVQHGDIPLLPGDYLRRKARSYADTPELELSNRPKSKPYAEIDIIAVVDGMLLIGEAKHRATLGPSRERRKIAQKLVDVADLLRADQIVLCTTDAGPWPDGEIDLMRGAILRLITGLGLDRINDFGGDVRR